MDKSSWLDLQLIRDAFRYGFSNIGASIGFVVASIVILIPAAILLMILLITFRQSGITSILTYAESFLLPLLVCPVFLGYMARCACSLREGKQSAPDLAEGFKELFIDGIKLIPLYLIWSIIGGALSFLLGFILYKPDGIGINYIYYSLLQFAVLLVPTVVLNFIYMLQIVDYSEHRSILRTIDPVKSINLMARDPGISIRTFIVFFIIHAVTGLLLLAWISALIISPLLIITLIPIPFLVLPIYAVYMYIVTGLYKGSGKNDKYSPPS